MIHPSVQSNTAGAPHGHRLAVTSSPVPENRALFQWDSTIGREFVSHPLIRGGHLQTLLSLTGRLSPCVNSQLHWVELPDGDRLALRDDQPKDFQLGDPCVMIVHGICGCSESGYMLRLSAHFTALGVRVFRLNLRGCGVGAPAAKSITHAGRSDDLLQALQFISQYVPVGALSVIGISLGGNQLLRAFGMLEQHSNPEVRSLRERVHRIAAISPPIDLVYCSDHLMKWSLRPYGKFFIRQLLSRVPDALVDAPEIVAAKRRVPRTLREFDERVTAPLGGFRDVRDYYDQSAAMHWLGNITVPTLVLAADDDPIVPFASLQPLRDRPASDWVRLVSTRGGGHVGFLARGKQRFWMDGLLERWFEFKPKPESAESHQRQDFPHPFDRFLQNG